MNIHVLGTIGKSDVQETMKCILMMFIPEMIEDFLHEIYYKESSVRDACVTTKDMDHSNAFVSLTEYVEEKLCIYYTRFLRLSFFIHLLYIKKYIHGVM